MIDWQECAQRDDIRRNVKKINVPQIAPLFEIQHDVLFRRMFVQ